MIKDWQHADENHTSWESVMQKAEITWDRNNAQNQTVFHSAENATNLNCLRIRSLI